MNTMLRITGKTTLALLVLVNAISARAQDEDDLENDKKENISWQQLPKPLETVVFNAYDLQHDGLFKIRKVEFGRIGFNSAPAMIWTLETTKTVSCRHIELIFEPIRHVHFYQIFKSVRADREEYLRERHDTILYLDSRVTTGSANSALLGRDELFRVWIYMKPDEVGLVVGSKATRLLFKKAVQ